MLSNGKYKRLYKIHRKTFAWKKLKYSCRVRLGFVNAIDTYFRLKI